MRLSVCTLVAEISGLKELLIVKQTHLGLATIAHQCAEDEIRGEKRKVEQEKHRAHKYKLIAEKLLKALKAEKLKR